MHVLCITYAWRYKAAVQRKVSMKWKSSWILKLMETSTVQCRRSHRCRHTVSQFMTIWNGPMADLYYAQKKALGHVVEGMRFRFQLRGLIRCLMNVFEAWDQEAIVLPPSLVDSSESNQSKLHCATRPTQTKKTKLTTTTDNKWFNFLCVSETHESLGGAAPYMYPPPP